MQRASRLPGVGTTPRSAVAHARVPALVIGPPVGRCRATHHQILRPHLRFSLFFFRLFPFLPFPSFATLFPLVPSDVLSCLLFWVRYYLSGPPAIRGLAAAGLHELCVASARAPLPFRTNITPSLSHHNKTHPPAQRQPGTVCLLAGPPPAFLLVFLLPSLHSIATTKANRQYIICSSPLSAPGFILLFSGSFSLKTWARKADRRFPRGLGRA